jgi:preprotein translocase subunit SecG
MYVMAGLFFGLAILFRWRSRKKIETSNTSDV